MNKIFNMKNLYTILFILALYLLFVVIFRDVIRAREFSIELKTIPFLIIAIIGFSWISRYFFNYTEHNLPNVKILIILLVSIGLSLTLQKFIHLPSNNNSLSTKKFHNPLYEEFIKIANKENLDLSFTKTAWIQRGPNNYKINTIFNEKPKSIDILFFGDSSIAWGLIPNVIEQMTGKKVAVYAYESNYLNVKSSKLFDKISKYYLKDNGIVIFSFVPGVLNKSPNSMIISKKQYDEIVQWTTKDFNQYAKQNEQSLFQKYFSFSSFNKLYDEKSEYLKTKYGFQLKSPSFYEVYLEPIINPKLSHNKMTNKNNDTKFIRWDMDSITEYNPKFNNRSIHSVVMPKKPMNNNNVKINAKAASKIYGEKIFMVTLMTNHSEYELVRNMYYTYYKNLDFKLCDLGVYQPKKDAYTMEGSHHTANTGGLMKSILIGKWLREYYLNKNIAVGKEIQFNYLKIYKEKFSTILANTPEDSIIYLPKDMVKNNVIEYMKKNNRKIITDLNQTVNSFYFIKNTLHHKLIKNYSLEQVNRKTLGDYLKQYYKDLVVLSVRDEAISHLSKESKKYFNSVGINIDLLKYRGSFAALIDNNKAITYDINNSAEVSLPMNIISKYGIERIISSGLKSGNKSEIIIEGKNLSKQKRGINYVIKKRDNEIISGAVDTHSKDQIGDLIIKASLKTNY